MPFLTATWKNLLVVNYAVDAELLAPYVPRGCELVGHEGQTFVSLVAFQFLDNAFLGRFPTYPSVDFEEANLRFYIRREVDGETRRAVAFIREVVPSRMIANIARALYNEPYVRHRMEFTQAGDELAYRWHAKGTVCELRARKHGELLQLAPGTHEHFILEHYWGYTSQLDARTCEYRVEHPPWRYQRVASHSVSASVAEFYGEPFRAVLARAPVSVFVAEGSAISVSTPHFFGAEEHTTGLLAFALGLPVVVRLRWRWRALYAKLRRAFGRTKLGAPRANTLPSVQPPRSPRETPP